MTSDEQLIERIQSSMKTEVAGLVPPRELLDAIEAPRSRRPLLPSFGGALAALGSVAAVAILVVALALIGHGPSRGAGTSPRTTRPSALPAGVAAAEHALVAQLAILRRPQTAADKLPPWAAREAFLQPGQNAKLIPGLTRLVATERSPFGSGDERVYMVVGLGEPKGVRALNGRTAYAPLPAYELHVTLIALTQRPRSLNPMANPGLVPPPADIPLSPGVMMVDIDGIGVVPDGVTRVKWVYEPWGYKPVALYPKIHGNVAIDRLIPREGPPVLRSATWYGAGGKVIASYSDAYWIDRENHFNAVTQSALNASYRQRIAPALREHFAVARLPRLKGFVAGGVSRNLAAKIVERNPYGLDVAYSHFVFYPGAMPAGTTSGAMVIPGSRGACLSGSNNLDAAVLPGFSCARLDRVDSGSFHVTTETAKGSRRVVGLVPDGNVSVTVLLAGGQTRTARVFDNVWALMLPAGPATLVVKDAAGQSVRSTL